MASSSDKTSRLLGALDMSMLANMSPMPAQPPVVDYSKERLRQARNRQLSQNWDQDNSENEEEMGENYQNLAGYGPGSGGSVVAGGFRLNYDSETPVRGIDVGGPDQAQKMSEFVTKSIDNLSHGLTVQTAMEALGLKEKGDLLPGVEVRLLPHQAIGVSWMVKQETESQHRGGILADDMGLGKTVQLIATMAAHLPNPESDCRLTLVVVPAALLLQWKEEIETKTNGLFTCHIHYGKDKLKKKSQLEGIDVIITTYQTLCTDFVIPGSVSPEDEQEWVAEHGGLLARTKFFRVVADEAQFIRNRATRASCTMALVRARHRWMLTGTPVTNTLADIYGLIRFGKFRPWNDWNDFNEYIGKVQMKDAVLAGERARKVLTPLLLRRTKNSTLEGKPILQLPPKDIELVTTEFSKDERELYDHFERNTQLKINRFMKQGTLAKNHAYILVLLQRLRQLCAHPNLVLSDANEDNITASIDGAAEKELARAVKSMGIAWFNKVKEDMAKRAATDWIEDDGTPDAAASCTKCEDLFTPNNGRVLKCGHEICRDCLDDIANGNPDHNGIFGEGDEGQNLAQEKEWESAIAKGHRPCPACKKMVSLRPDSVFNSSAFRSAGRDGQKSSSRSSRGKKRFEGAYLPWNDDESDSDGESDADMKPQPKKRPSLEKVAPKATVDFTDIVDSDDDLPDLGTAFGPASSSPPAEETKPKVVKAGSRKRIVDSDDDMEVDTKPLKKASSSKKPAHETSSVLGKRSRKDNAAHTKDLFDMWSKGDSDLEPSAKMLLMIDFIEEWEESGDKIIVFSQWTSNLDLIERLLTRHGIRYLRYDGSMDRSSRERTLATFKKSGGPRVIMISTKCGGVGLNLVSANRIINMDLSWNYASESQAYDRVHRLGQDKDVFIKRLVVRDTIEERMLKLQDVKVGLAEAALGEGTGANLHRLSVKDIQLLFGMNKGDQNRGRQGSEQGSSP